MHSAPHDQRVKKKRMYATLLGDTVDIHFVWGHFRGIPLDVCDQYATAVRSTNIDVLHWLKSGACFMVYELLYMSGLHTDSAGFKKGDGSFIST